ncbi:MAG TPA: hypothetical protein DDY38_09635 [Firmicutes bacterium]|jgi:hypothetical protein|nr:hypothetical protein [Bacillota bacterium]
MILPSKHLSQERALLTVGANILQHLNESKTVSGLWEDCRGGKTEAKKIILSFDSFILALDLLYILGAIELHEGLLVRRQ